VRELLSPRRLQGPTFTPHTDGRECRPSKMTVETARQCQPSMLTRACRTIYITVRQHLNNHSVYYTSQKWRHYLPSPAHSACLYVCLSVCLFVIYQNSNTRPKFTKCSVHVTCGRGSAILWRQCNTLCISGFVDDVTFYIMEGIDPIQRRAHLSRNQSISLLMISVFYV